MRQKIGLLSVLISGILLMFMIGIVSAQGDVVTADDVNAVAKQLYCPVCENIPLDNCGTAACADWRYEIQLQLEAGMTEQEIIDDFVHRFGDRVVGTPQDPLLRAIAVSIPWLFTIVGGLSVIYLLVRIRLQKTKNVMEPTNMSDDSADHYQTLLERDLSG